jgi:bacterioferritin
MPGRGAFRAPGGARAGRPAGTEGPAEINRIPRRRAMKGDPKLLERLNELLADELTAINQYMVHSEICDNWGYARLHEKIEKRAITEMKHAEELIGRIIFLEGTPRVDKLNKINIGDDVPKQLANDLAAENHALRAYNEAIEYTHEIKDATSRQMLEKTAHDEEEHIDWIEEQQDQIKHMGLQLYLAEQTHEEKD